MNKKRYILTYQESYEEHQGREPKKVSGLFNNIVDAEYLLVSQNNLYGKYLMYIESEDCEEYKNIA